MEDALSRFVRAAAEDIRRSCNLLTAELYAILRRYRMGHSISESLLNAHDLLAVVLDHVATIVSNLEEQP